MSKQIKREHAGKRARSVKRIAKNRHVMAKVKASIERHIDELAADHDRYFDGFMGGWANSSLNIDNLARAFMDYANAGFTKEHVDNFLAPYEPLFNWLHSRLVDEMTANEENQFREAVKANVSAWSKLAAAMKMRYEGKGEPIGRMFHCISSAADYLSQRYTGEIPEAPVTKEFSSCVAMARKILETFAVEVEP